MRDFEPFNMRDRFAVADPLLNNSEIEWFERMSRETGVPAPGSRLPEILSPSVRSDPAKPRVFHPQSLAVVA